ncbi:SDR family NAD(P)-dependent oxidoreductase [Usitatibacter palustris]|uniref:Short-chain dehydrogenase n=1 Tax=Usitatibacter palustris TaxID=2732487 RepID=A0A6M4H9R5_9PROT|nr:SDR family NAD(P)-dependent oxidoreductase [Usitatibacter palustris]QJR16509.1 hypothetical protein DSM104440_03344 [Usitatibacter palustris]
MKALIVGATAGLGRALAECLAAKKIDLFLVASDERDLRALASHLELTHGIAVRTLARSVTAEAGWASEVRALAEKDAPVDYLLFPVGASRDDDTGMLADDRALELFGANLIGITHLAGAFLPGMLARKSGCIAGFGSIAAARGRAKNVIYSASKSALRTYFESLMHIGAAHGLRVHFYVIGYLDTQQSYGKRLPLPVASPASVAERVVASLDGRSHVAHLPRFWFLVEAIVRAVPFFVYRMMARRA